MSEYWTLSEAARLAGVSRQFLVKLIKQGVVEGRLPTRGWVVSGSDLREWMRSSRWLNFAASRLLKSQDTVPDGELNARQVAKILGLPANVVAVLIGLEVIPSASQRQHGMVLKESLIQWYASRRKPLDEILDSRQRAG